MGFQIKAPGQGGVVVPSSLRDVQIDGTPNINITQDLSAMTSGRTSNTLIAKPSGAAQNQVDVEYRIMRDTPDNLMPMLESQMEKANQEWKLAQKILNIYGIAAFR